MSVHPAIYVDECELDVVLALWHVYDTEPRHRQQKQNIICICLTLATLPLYKQVCANSGEC